MNEYNLPTWYLRIFEIICDYQQAENEEANCISGVLIGYLKALIDVGVITEKQSLKFFYLLMVA